MHARFALTLAATLLATSFAAQAGDSRLNCVSGVLDTAAAPSKKQREAEELDVVALTSDGRLVCLNEQRPSRARIIGTVNGLVQDTKLVGIDFRVQDGKLYGVGEAGGVYTLDTSNGLATFVNRLSTPLVGTSFGVDFNPVADRLRIVSNEGQNLRHNVNAGGVTLSDGALNYAAGTTALGVTGAAYTNNDLTAAAPAPATTGTSLFVLDSSLDQIVLQSPPNAGSLVATGKLTLDTSALTGFDIYSTVVAGVTTQNRALASLTTVDGTGLYDINVLTGKATLLGKLPASLTVVDIAVPLNQN